jgi:aryl-alcohol dehydrogenase-like predicted oxidoreductase
METVRISGTELDVSRIGLGTWAIGGAAWGGTDEQESIRTIHEAIDHGVTLIDTAPAYGQGRSEEIVGRALAEHPKGRDVVVATKVGLDWTTGGLKRNSRPERLRQELEDSLRRLRRDCIDVYQVHWPDSSVPFEETARVLDGFRGDGKIRAIGVSNFSPEQMDAFRRGGPLHTAQPPYNLFEREAEGEVLPYCRQHGITTLTYGAICRGLLSGRMTAETRFAEGEIRRIDPKFQPPRFEQYLAAVAALDTFAQERYQRRVIHLALRWVLDQPGVGVALWGARHPGQLEPLRGALGWSLDEVELRDLDRIVRENVRDPVGAEFMAPPMQ